MNVERKRGKKKQSARAITEYLLFDLNTHTFREKL